MAVPLILDTDIGTDVDDALALAFALRHSGIELRAVTTVADDVVKRAHIATKLLRIAGREDVPVAPGVGWTEPPAGRRSWFGHEGKDLLDESDRFPEFERDAVSLLLETGDTELATVGVQSNIAAALDRDPGFASRIPRLHVMGGVFEAIADRHWGEHNLSVDPDASLRALNAGIPTRYTPLNVTLGAPLLRSHLEALRGGDELCRALARLVDIWAAFVGYKDDTVALLHDPLAVAAAVDERFVTIEQRSVRIALVDGVVRPVFDDDGRPCEVVTSADAAAFADFWLETVTG
ncbi:MAG: nucleoside hydrolase [Actinomycetota bacterium]